MRLKQTATNIAAAVGIGAVMICLGYLFYLRFVVSPDMSEARFLLTYWREWLALAGLAIAVVVGAAFASRKEGAAAKDKG